MSVPSAVALVPRFTPCQGEGNKLEVEEVWQEVEQAPCTLHMLKTGCIHTQLHLIVILYSKHSYIRLCGQWCVVDKVNGTATLTKLVCVRSQKRTLAEQEIPELSRVCSAIIYYFACCAHSEHTTNVRMPLNHLSLGSSKIPILCDCDCVRALTYVQDRCGSRDWVGS